MKKILILHSLFILILLSSFSLHAQQSQTEQVVSEQQAQKKTNLNKLAAKLIKKGSHAALCYGPLLIFLQRILQNIYDPDGFVAQHFENQSEDFNITPDQEKSARQFLDMVIKKSGLEKENVKIKSFSGESSAYSFPGCSSECLAGFAAGIPGNRTILLSQEELILTDRNLCNRLYLYGHEAMHHKHNDWAWHLAGVSLAPVVSHFLIKGYDRYIGTPFTKWFRKKLANTQEKNFAEKIEMIHTTLFKSWWSWIPKSLLAYLLYARLVVWREHEADRGCLELFGKQAARGCLQRGGQSDFWHPSRETTENLARKYL